jgi:hypothetical protein
MQSIFRLFLQQISFLIDRSVNTAYAHKTILDQIGDIHGRINGFFVLGNGTTSDACASQLSHNHRFQ